MDYFECNLIVRVLVDGEKRGSELTISQAVFYFKSVEYSIAWAVSGHGVEDVVWIPRALVTLTNGVFKSCTASNAIQISPITARETVYLKLTFLL